MYRAISSAGPVALLGVAGSAALGAWDGFRQGLVRYRAALLMACAGVPALPESHAWSCIPPHARRLLLCNGPRCTRRGALPLWKLLREELKAVGRLETEDGVHITRTQCQFPCDQGPTLSVYPSGEWYRIRDAAEVRRLVQERFVEERAVPELIMRA